MSHFGNVSGTQWSSFTNELSDQSGRKAKLPWRKVKEQEDSEV